MDPLTIIRIGLGVVNEVLAAGGRAPLSRLDQEEAERQALKRLEDAKAADDAAKASMEERRRRLRDGQG